MYPDEKPPSLSVLTHRCSLATRKLTRHLLAIPYILVRMGAPYEDGRSTQFYLPRNYGTIFNPRFLKSLNWKWNMRGYWRGFSALFCLIFILSFNKAWKLSPELELNPVEFQLKQKSRMVQKLFDLWIDL